MNKIIAQKIKESRKEKQITQKELAEHLGKNAVSISDIERNRVEVSASELHKIAKYLDKPIEYFYDENIKSNEIQEIVSMLKRQSVKDINNLYRPIKLIVQLKDIENISRKFPPNEQIPPEKLIEFSSVVFPLRDTIEKLSEKVNIIADMLYKEMKVNNLKIPKK